jgi:Putative transposase
VKPAEILARLGRGFLIHVLPDGFHRIRYYGFLGNCHRARKLALLPEPARDAACRAK